MAKNDDAAGQGAGFDTNFDSRLLGAEDVSDSAERAGKLNEAKRQGDEAGTEDGTEPQSLREAVIAEKREQEKKNQAAAGLKGMATAPMQAGTSKLLQSAWEYLIPSWGLTLIWINIHVFLSWVIGRDVFCKLGDEWLSGAMPGGANPAQAAMLGQSAGAAKEKIGSCANLGESIVLAILDLVALAVIFALLMIIGGLLKIVDNPLEALNALFGWAWSVLKGIVSN